MKYKKKKKDAVYGAKQQKGVTLGSLKSPLMF